MQQTHTKKLGALLVAATLAFGLCGTGLVDTREAFADNTEIDALLAEAQERIEQTAQDYDQATAKAEALQGQIEENLKKIDDLEGALPDQEERSATAMVALYKMQQEGFSLVTMILNAGSLEEFISSIEYLNTIHQTTMNEVLRLQTMRDDLQNTKRSLQESKMAVDAEKVRAEEALKEAQAAREEAQRRAEEEAARQAAARQAEIERQAAAERVKAESKAKEADEADSAGNGGGEAVPKPEASATPPAAPKPASPGAVDWSLDKATFVSTWTARIDAYLAGSPLGGQGRTFAEAAWNYGVDPRFSPAISNTESTKGRYCFKPHNAWGWGSVSWGSWEEAINAHVRGLANGYGGAISIAGAKKYCPPNWEHWYNATLNEMNKM
ncbi:MAG: hypothetical protein FWG23_06020 [Eggerthellaceae bacterium]|nr:hypothetical protein [Eggerthellaceae bacterium]